MKHKILIALCIFGFGTAYGQNSAIFAPDVVASSGGFETVSTYSFSWTLGETVIETVQGTTTIFTQGFQQPIPDFFLEVNEAEKESGFLVYPNPASDVINIVLADKKKTPLNIDIYDLQGKQLLNKSIAGSMGEYRLNISTFANGPLFLRITDNKNKELNTCIIIKN